MIVKLSKTASDAMLDRLSQLMNAGRLELYSGDGLKLAVLQLSDPAARKAVGGALDLNRIAEEDAALANGSAKIGRIIGADGSEVLSCDVGDEYSDAVIRLNTTVIFRGGPVRITSFRLEMP